MAISLLLPSCISARSARGACSALSAPTVTPRRGEPPCARGDRLGWNQTPNLKSGSLIAGGSRAAAARAALADFPPPPPLCSSQLARIGPCQPPRRPPSLPLPGVTRTSAKRASRATRGPSSCSPPVQPPFPPPCPDRLPADDPPRRRRSPGLSGRTGRAGRRCRGGARARGGRARRPWRTPRTRSSARRTGASSTP